MSPTQRSLAECRKRGWFVDITERWIPVSPAGYKGPILRKDWGGFVDLIAVGGGSIWFIQTTSGSNLSARRKKITVDHADILRQLRANGARVLIHGWAPHKIKRGGTAVRFELREEEVDPAPNTDGQRAGE